MYIHNDAFAHSLTMKLNQNESILWIGQPDPTAYQKRFAQTTLLITTATSMILGSWLLYMMSYTKILWFVWLIPIGLMFYGAIQYKKIIRDGNAWENEFYVITNHRIITSRFEELTFIYGSIDLDDIKENRIKIYNNSVGTITLISKATFVDAHITIGWINDAKFVHGIINDLIRLGCVDRPEPGSS